MASTTRNTCKYTMKIGKKIIKRNCCDMKKEINTS